MTRPTEVKMVLANKGMERGVIILFQELLERQSTLEQTMQENGAALYQMASIIAKTVDGASAMRDQIEKMRGATEGDDDTPLAS